MLTYHVDSNIILIEPFQSQQNRHRLTAENRIMYRLQKNGHNVDIKILDNKCSDAYKIQLEEKWESTYQLVPLDMNHHNTAK